MHVMHESVLPGAGPGLHGLPHGTHAVPMAWMQGTGCRTCGHSGVRSVHTHATMPQSLAPTGRPGPARSGRSDPSRKAVAGSVPGGSTSSSASTSRPEGGTEHGSPARARW
jgi:hypothetical protein